MINALDNTGYSENEYDQMSYRKKAILLLECGEWTIEKRKKIEILKEQSLDSPCEEYRKIYCENCRLFIPNKNDTVKCKALSDEIVNCIKIRKFIDE